MVQGGWSLIQTFRGVQRRGVVGRSYLTCRFNNKKKTHMSLLLISPHITCRKTVILKNTNITCLITPPVAGRIGVYFFLG